jgi:hypothetical protein
LYLDISQSCGLGWPEYTGAPTRFTRGIGYHGGAYLHDRYYAKQLHLMQSLHAEGLPLPSEGSLRRVHNVHDHTGMPTGSYHPVLPWLRSIGYPFPTSLVDCEQDVTTALTARRYGL